MSTSPTTPDAIIGIGWSKGIAAQLSLPNMSVRRPLGGARVGFVDRTRSRRQRL